MSAPNAVKELQTPTAPTLRQDHVQGVCYNQTAQPDRYFYLYDVQTDLVFEADGYKQPKAPEANPNDPDEWIILLMCPACHQTLRLDSAKKQFQVTKRGIETAEPIGCSYWLQDVEGYSGPCPFRAEFQPPKQVEFGDVRLRSGQRHRVKIDAWIREA